MLSRLQSGEIVAVLDLSSARSGSRLFHIRNDEVRAPFGVEVSNLGNIDFFAPRLVRSDDYVIGARVGSVTNCARTKGSWLQFRKGPPER